MSAAQSDRPNYARELRYMLTDAFAVCERLGLLNGRGAFKRQAGGVIVRCPAHEERTPSCSVRRGPDGTIAWKCHGCEASGDVLTLVATVHGLSTRSDFREVLRVAADLAGAHAIVHELTTGERTARRVPERPAPPPEPPREYPSASEVSALWEASIPVTDDVDASEWLTGRGLDPDLVAADDLARVLPKDARAPRWAAYQRVSWTETGHRLIVPMRDAQGAVRSVRGCRVADGDSPKRLPPGGHKATGLVMACPIGVAMLQGLASPPEVVVVEGEPDFLTWATRRTDRVTARIGIISGSWSFAMAQRVPAGAEVWIRTDHDAAGERYASELVRTLRWQGCFVRRGGLADG